MVKFKWMPATLIAVLYHLLVVVLLYVTLYGYHVLDAVPNNKNLVLWDAYWYNSIRQSGYVFVPYNTCNLAFFPLFPLMWKLLQASPLLMAGINYCLFSLCFIFLLRDKSYPLYFYLFFLSVPSLIFFALPYSEALFFLTATVLLRGYKTNSTWLINTGFLLSSMVRSVSMLFIPAIIICEVIFNQSLSKKEKIYNVVVRSSFTIFGLLIVSALQAYQTGKWFYFIEIQKFWKRHWIIPQLPLTTYSPERMLGIDAIAFMIGIAAIYFCIKWLLENLGFLRVEPSRNIPRNQAVVFSLFCLAGTTLLDVLFTFNYNGSTNIWSINRHIFCTPFILIFLSSLLYEFNLSSGDKYFLFFSIVAGVFITGLYKYLDQTFYYTLFFFSLYVMRYHVKLTPYLIGVYLINVVLQVHFFNNFLKELWIG